MSVIFNDKISSEEQSFLFSKFDNFYTVDDRNCFIYRGEVMGGYPSLRVTFRGRRIRLRVHRLTFYLLNNAEPLNCSMHVSHLCHEKLCINIEHLSYEPNAINCQRNLCYEENKCFGHQGYKHCII